MHVPAGLHSSGFGVKLEMIRSGAELGGAGMAPLACPADGALLDCGDGASVGWPGCDGAAAVTASAGTMSRPNDSSPTILPWDRILTRITTSPGDDGAMNVGDCADFWTSTEPPPLSTSHSYVRGRLLGLLGVTDSVTSELTGYGGAEGTIGPTLLIEIEGGGGGVHAVSITRTPTMVASRPSPLSL